MRRRHYNSDDFDSLCNLFWRYMPRLVYTAQVSDDDEVNVIISKFRPTTERRILQFYFTTPEGEKRDIPLDWDVARRMAKSYVSKEIKKSPDSETAVWEAAQEMLRNALDNFLERAILHKDAQEKVGFEERHSLAWSPLTLSQLKKLYKGGKATTISIHSTHASSAVIAGMLEMNIKEFLYLRDTILPVPTEDELVPRLLA